MANNNGGRVVAIIAAVLLGYGAGWFQQHFAVSGLQEKVSALEEDLKVSKDSVNSVDVRVAQGETERQLALALLAARSKDSAAVEGRLQAASGALDVASDSYHKELQGKIVALQQKPLAQQSAGIQALVQELDSAHPIAAGRGRPGQ